MHSECKWRCEWSVKRTRCGYMRHVQSILNWSTKKLILIASYHHRRVTVTVVVVVISKFPCLQWADSAGPHSAAARLRSSWLGLVLPAAGGEVKLNLFLSLTTSFRYEGCDEQKPNKRNDGVYPEGDLAGHGGHQVREGEGGNERQHSDPAHHQPGHYCCWDDLSQKYLYYKRGKIASLKSTPFF